MTDRELQSSHHPIRIAPPGTAVNRRPALFLDRDGNGTVSNAGEFSFIDDATDARSDLEGLRAFDSNRDGLLSSLDVRFGEFRVWQDRDGDGAAETGEILTLATAGVRSLNLTGTAVNGTTEFGDVAVINRGSYTRTNGTTMSFFDAALTYFSSATNLPEIAVQELDFGRRSGRYSISLSNLVILRSLSASPPKAVIARGILLADSSRRVAVTTISAIPRSSASSDSWANAGAAPAPSDAKTKAAVDIFRYALNFLPLNHALSLQGYQISTVQIETGVFRKQLTKFSSLVKLIPQPITSSTCCD